MEPRPYKVSKVTGEPNFDAVPVAKIIDYPLERRDYKPFAQCILCLGDTRLSLRMWAFEVSPPETSALQCVLYLYPDRPELALSVRLEHSGGETVAVSVRPMEDGRERQPSAKAKAALSGGMTASPHNGEDLQGVYWGMTVSLPLAALELLGGPTALTPGRSFPGNFYKTCADERFAHLGSYFPAAFPHSPYGPVSMGPFQVVSY